MTEHSHPALRPSETEPVHMWFSLGYAQYLTVPRSVLQSMPTEWQQRFVACLVELDDTIDWHSMMPDGWQYRVTLHRPEYGEPEAAAYEGRDVDEYAYWGPDLFDPLGDYERGRRRLPTIDEASDA